MLSKTLVSNLFIDATVRNMTARYVLHASQIRQFACSV